MSTAYDEVAYPDLVHYETLPDNMELIGRLFRMKPCPAPEARVLEIGCACGANLLAMAERHPNARFVGIDLSGPQIEAGRAVQEAVGLRNVELSQLDLTKLDDSHGKFDYIIAHGLYSWVPPEVRTALLRVIEQRLAPQGIALVSHNTKPGWYAKGMVSGMMRWHVRRVDDPPERVEQARALLQLLVLGAQPKQRLYRATLAERLQGLRDTPDGVLFHDELGDICEGSWIHEVATDLERHRLQVLGDSDLETLYPNGLSPDVVNLLGDIAKTFIDRLQYLDLLNNRHFRMTLVCRRDLALSRTMSPGQLGDLYLSSEAAASPEAHPDPRAEGAVGFATPGARMEVEEAATKEALLILRAQWPLPMPFTELVARVGGDRAALGVAMLECVTAGIVYVSPRPPRFTTAVPARPEATPLARNAAARGARVPNLLHLALDLDEADRKLITLLDGTRDHEALAAATGRSAADLAAALDRLARSAMFVATPPAP